MRFLARGRLRRWVARSEPAIVEFVSAIPLLDPASPPQSLVGLGDQLSTAADRFDDWLAHDPPPVAGLADAWGAVAHMISALGDVLQRFD